MIFKTNYTGNGIRIPASALRLAVLENEEDLNLHIKRGMLTVLPARMTVEQLLQTVQNLHCLEEMLMEDGAYIYGDE